MVRLGEARSRRDLVWQGEAGAEWQIMVRHVELGIGELRPGEAGLAGKASFVESGVGELRSGEAG